MTSGETPEDEGQDERVPAVLMSYGENPTIPTPENKRTEFTIGKCQPQQKEELLQLLQRNDDLFVQNDIDLTQTDLVEMSLETNDHPPIAQRMRRMPFQKRALVKQHVQEMLTAGVIRPSNSP